MTIQTECGGCGKSYQLADTAAGKRLRCKDCGEIFEVPTRRRPASARKGASEEEDFFGSLAAEESAAEATLPPPAARPRSSGTKTRKKKSSSGGWSMPQFALSFNLNRFNLALLVIGGVLLFVAFQEYRLAGAAKAEPQRISCSQLAAQGPGNNAYVELTDFDLTDNFVYEERNGNWSWVWIPAVPRTAPAPGAIPFPEVGGLLKRMAGPGNIKVIIKSGSVKNEHDLSKLVNRPLRGMVINKIASLGREEKKLLQETYPGTNFDTCWIVQEGRTPASQGKLFGFLIGGISLMGIGTVLVFGSGE